jgi:hypothetical protein
MRDPWDEDDPQDDPYDDLSNSEYYEDRHEADYRRAYEESEGELEHPDLTWPRCECCDVRLTDPDKEIPLCLACDMAGCGRGACQKG